MEREIMKTREKKINPQREEEDEIAAQMYKLQQQELLYENLAKKYIGRVRA